MPPDPAAAGNREEHYHAVPRLAQRAGLYGPYTLRRSSTRYVTTGNVLPTDLAKSEEMPDWVPCLAGAAGISSARQSRCAHQLQPIPGVARLGIPVAACHLSRPASQFCTGRSVLLVLGFFTLRPVQLLDLDVCRRPYSWMLTRAPPAARLSTTYIAGMVFFVQITILADASTDLPQATPA